MQQILLQAVPIVQTTCDYTKAGQSNYIRYPKRVSCNPKKSYPSSPTGWSALGLGCHSGTRDVVEVAAAGTRRQSRKQYPEPCTESLSLPYPTCFALLAVADDERRLQSISETNLAERGSEGGSLAGVVTKICEDMLFLRLQQQLRFPHRTPSRPFGKSRGWLVRLGGSLELRGRLLATLYALKTCLAASFARALHHFRPT